MIAMFNDYVNKFGFNSKIFITDKTKNICNGLMKINNINP